MADMVDHNIDSGKHKFGDVFILLQVMIWLRLGSVILLLTSGMVFALIASCLYCFGCLEDDIVSHGSQKASLKSVNEFISEN
jgi:hypothetical protein